LGEYNKTFSIHTQIVVRPPLLEENVAVVFFYGASKNGGEKCGAGAVLKCPKGGIFSIKMNCGMGTNTRGELMALWSLLFFVYISSLIVYSCLEIQK
jgi:hypothetical protein